MAFGDRGVESGRRCRAGVVPVPHLLIAMSVPLSERCRTMIDSVGRKVNDGPKHTLDAPEK